MVTVQAVSSILLGGVILKTLTDVFVCKFVRQSDSLRLVFDRASIDNGMLELLNNGFVNGVAL
jgi:hypothetical protein